MSINQTYYEALAYVTTATTTFRAFSDFPKSCFDIHIHNYIYANVDQIKFKSIT